MTAAVVGRVKGVRIIGTTDDLGIVPVERLIHSHNNCDEIPTVFVGEVFA